MWLLLEPASKSPSQCPGLARSSISSIFSKNAQTSGAWCCRLGGIWLVAGFSPHEEFDQLAVAGFTPLEALKMTTLNDLNGLKNRVQKHMELPRRRLCRRRKPHFRIGPL